MQDSYTLQLRDGASLVSLARQRTFVGSDVLPPRKGGGIRGEVKRFSAASRRRLLRKLAIVRRDEISRALFITLTYPEQFPSVERSKRDLAAFRKRLLRKYSNCSGIQKLEFQERGAPHFHILLFGVPFLPYKEVAKIWADICGYSGSEYAKHLVAGTQVKRVCSYHQAVSYVAKYMGKLEQFDVEGVGRFWSVFGDLEKFCGELMRMVIPASQAAQVARVLGKIWIASVRKGKDGKKVSRAKRARGQSRYYRRTWFCPEKFIQYLFWLWSVA